MLPLLQLLWMVAAAVVLLHCAPVLSWKPGAGQVQLYLVRERWHTGIVLPRSLAERCIPEAVALPPAPWVDIGWGEADFYQTPGFDLHLAVKAILWRNESVVRLAAVPLELRRYYGAESWLLPLCLDSAQFERLCRFLWCSLRRDSLGNASLSSLQASGWVRFYRAHGTYWGLQTCNTWVAQALSAAGFPMVWHGIVLAEQLFAHVSRFRCPHTQ